MGIAGKLLGSLALTPNILIETQKKFGIDSAKVQLGASSYISPRHYYVLNDKKMPLNFRAGTDGDDTTESKTVSTRPTQDECNLVKKWCKSELQKRMENRLACVA